MARAHTARQGRDAMTERRYREDEVRKIFGLATTQNVPERSAPTTVDGLTLPDIQSIGLEVGLEPDAIARAAATLDSGAVADVRKSWGEPVEVLRTVSLPRAPTDHEWELLVAELRATFRARGKITTHGGLREWRNGNLYASIEPTETGNRLRMGTFKGDASSVNALGAVGIVASTITFGSLAFWGVPTSVGDVALYLGPLLLGGGGIVAIAANRLRLPRWRNERSDQMAHIAARIQTIMGTGSAENK